MEFLTLSIILHGRDPFFFSFFAAILGNVVFSITAETKDDKACGDKAPRNINIDYRDTQIRTLLVEVLLTALTVCPVLLFMRKLKHSRSTKSK